MRRIVMSAACLLAGLQAKAETIYNGESVKYSASSSWDGNGSSLKQASAAPFSKPNHLRATLKVKNWWGGAAYVPKAWQPFALTGDLSFQLKSSKSHELVVQLHDASKKSSDPYKLSVGTSYKQYVIPRASLTGVDLSKITALVFAVNLQGTTTYTVDIDNIETGSVAPAPTPTPAPPVTGGVKAKARELAMDLNWRPFFMTGGTFGDKVPSKIDLYYRYLVGGWRKWNAPDGEYALMVMRQADAQGAVPIITYYKLAYEFEKKNYGFITGELLHEYLQDMRVLFQKMAAFDKPVLLHVEPDFFGYAQQYAKNSAKQPKDIYAKVRWSDIPECKTLPESLDSVTGCIITMARAIAPKAKLGFHASHWGDWYDMNDPNAPAKDKAYSVADFLKTMGADRTDFITLETTDRDAGFQESQGQKNVYWAPKDFENHLTWVGYISERLQKPVLWWQMPFGVPSDTPGGTPGHYRDNRLPTFYGMIPRLIGLGGFGMVFGAGAEGQTTADTDGGQFKKFNDIYQGSRTEIK